jgi:hypothetical protein
VTCALAALVPAAAFAATKVATAAGPRVGFGLSPDQFVLGGQLDFRELTSDVLGEIGPDVTFTPNLELSFGSDRTDIAFNFDLHYLFTIEGSQWRPYVGAGITLDAIKVDNRAGRDVSETEVGGGFLVGAIVPTRREGERRLFAEMRLGFGSWLMHDAKLIVGWNLGFWVFRAAEEWRAPTMMDETDERPEGVRPPDREDRCIEPIVVA